MKSLNIFFAIAVLGVTLFAGTQNQENIASIGNTITTFNKKSPTNIENADFVLGNWKGTGFVTDESGNQQYVEIESNNLTVSNSEYQLVTVGKNPSNSFIYSSNKMLFFNSNLNKWFTKGKINEIVLHDSQTLLTDNSAITYSYYDFNSVLVRHTISRENDDSYTETEERWSANGWDKTAWFRMKRDFNNPKSTARPLH